MAERQAGGVGGTAGYVLRVVARRKTKRQTGGVGGTVGYTLRAGANGRPVDCGQD